MHKIAVVTIDESVYYDEAVQLASIHLNEESVLLTRVTTAPAPTSAKYTAPAAAVLAIATFICVLEGFDLAVWGASIPLILGDRSFGLTLPAAGVIGAIVSVGMLVGAGLAGALVHRVGQLRLIAIATVVFSVGMLVCAIAPDAAAFGIGRLVVGLGLGVVLPTVNAYTADLSRPGRVARNIGFTMAGYGFGALCAPLLAAALQGTGFRWLYVIGVIPALLILPLLRVLPQSPAELWRRGDKDAAVALAERYGVGDPSTQEMTRPGRFLGLGALFARGIWPSTLLFWVMSFCGLLLVFGISAWITTILQLANYPVSNALLLTAAMWTGVIVGVIIGGALAPRTGAKPLAIAAFLFGAASLTAMSFGPPEAVMYVLMFFGGFGFVGAQVMSNALVVTRYPIELRSNGLAWALSIGRVGAIVGPPLGAALIASGVGVQWNFWAFAIPSLIGVLAAALVPRITSKDR